MDQLSKIFNKVVGLINNAIDSLDHKYIDMIRQVFFLTVFVTWIVGLTFGIIKGRAAALEGGIVLISETNDLFRLHIRESKRDSDFREVLASEIGTISAPSSFAKEQLQRREPATPVSRDLIIEHERTPRIEFSLPPVEQTVDVDRVTLPPESPGIIDERDRRNQESSPGASMGRGDQSTIGNPPAPERNEGEALPEVPTMSSTDENILQ